MDNRKHTGWNWIYPISFPVSILTIVTLFGIWISGTMSRESLFRIMLVSTVFIVILTVFYWTKLISKIANGTSLFQFSTIKAFFITFVSYLLILWTIDLKPAPNLNCDFDLKSLTTEIKSKFNPDTVTIRTVVIQEEIYFPKIICPRITIVNPTTETIDFKTIDENQTRFNNYEEIENKLKAEGQFIADRISKSCNIADYNDLIIDFVKYQKDRNGFDHRFIIHYNEKMP